MDKVVQERKKSGQNCPERGKMDRNEIKGKGEKGDKIVLYLIDKCNI